MEELKVHIQHAILWEFKNYKNDIDTVKYILIFMAKVSLLAAKFKTDLFKFRCGDTSLRD